MSILESILSVLDDHAAGEMPVAKVTERVLKRVASLEAVAGNLREATRLKPMQSIQTRRRQAPVDVFGRLIAQPKPGIWKITDEGRNYLRSLD